MIDVDGPGARDAVARLEELYRDPQRTIDSILRETGLGKRRFYAVVRQEGWAPRTKASPGRRSGREAPVEPAGVSAPRREAAPAPVDRRAMASRLERFIANRIADIDREPAPADVERQARTLNQLTRTATAIRSYLETLTEESRDDDDAPPPRSLSALRDELRGHLERIRDEEFSRALRGDLEPG